MPFPRLPLLVRIAQAGLRPATGLRATPLRARLPKKGQLTSTGQAHRQAYTDHLLLLSDMSDRLIWILRPRWRWLLREASSPARCRVWGTTWRLYFGASLYMSVMQEDDKCPQSTLTKESCKRLKCWCSDTWCRITLTLRSTCALAAIAVDSPEGAAAFESVFIPYSSVGLKSL